MLMMKSSPVYNSFHGDECTSYFIFTFFVLEDIDLLTLLPSVSYPVVTMLISFGFLSSSVSFLCAVEGAEQ